MAKPIQLGFSARFQIFYCLVMIVITAAASWFLYLLMNKSLSGGYVESLRTLYFLEQNLPTYLSILALLQTFFVLILTLVIVLLVSHQIAGPVFRYEDVLARISKGEVPAQVTTRSSDQLKTTVDSLNDLTGRLRYLYGKAGELQRRMANQSAAWDSHELVELKLQIADVREAMAGFEAGELTQ